jgi:hypothetical protein
MLERLADQVLLVSRYRRQTLELPYDLVNLRRSVPIWKEVLSLDLEDINLGWVDFQLSDVLETLWWHLLKDDYHIQDVAHANPPSSFQSAFLGRHDAFDMTGDECLLGLVDCLQYNLAIDIVLEVVHKLLQDFLVPFNERVAMCLIHYILDIQEEVHGIWAEHDRLVPQQVVETVAHRPKSSNSRIAICITH